MEEAPTLYREAAALSTEDPQVLLDWVNRRGMLWWPVPDDPRTPVLATLVVLGRSPEHAVVPFTKVKAALQALQQAVELLDALRGRGKMPRDWSLLPISVEQFREAKPLARRLLVPADYVLAWAALERIVSLRLRLTATFSSLPFGSRHLLSKRALLGVSGLQVHFAPISLESCLWFQFYTDAFGGRPARVCPGCGEVLIPSRVDQQWHRECYRRQYNRNYRDRTRNERELSEWEDRVAPFGKSGRPRKGRGAPP
jgi:hypothetical protein